LKYKYSYIEATPSQPSPRGIIPKGKEVEAAWLFKSSPWGGFRWGGPASLDFINLMNFTNLMNLINFINFKNLTN